MAVSWESKKLYSVGEPPLLPKHNDEVVEKKKRGETKQHYQAFNEQQAKKVTPACTFTLLIPLSVYPSDSITWQGISDKNH